jgi:hypothetical protein
MRQMMKLRHINTAKEGFGFWYWNNFLCLIACVRAGFVDRIWLSVKSLQFSRFIGIQPLAAYGGEPSSSPGHLTGICGEQCGTATGFSPSAWVSPCRSTFHQCLVFIIVIGRVLCSKTIWRRLSSDRLTSCRLVDIGLTFQGSLLSPP